MARKDFQDDPEWIEFEERSQRELVPKLSDSAFAIHLQTGGKPDIKQALELGLSILMDKPIILAVVPGSKVPERLARAADEIVEFTPGDPHDKAFSDAISRVVKKLNLDE